MRSDNQDSKKSDHLNNISCALLIFELGNEIKLLTNTISNSIKFLNNYIQFDFDIEIDIVSALIKDCAEVSIFVDAYEMIENEDDCIAELRHFKFSLRGSLEMIWSELILIYIFYKSKILEPTRFENVFLNMFSAGERLAIIINPPNWQYKFSQIEF